MVISKNHAVIVIEDLKVKNMPKSAVGTVSQPGCNVGFKPFDTGFGLARNASAVVILRKKMTCHKASLRVRYADILRILMSTALVNFSCGARRICLWRNGTVRLSVEAGIHRSGLGFGLHTVGIFAL